MADVATININGVVLPDAISHKFTGKTSAYTPADTTEGWYYKKTDIAGGTSASTADLIAGNFLNKSGDGTASGSARDTVHVNDVVKFLYIENKAVEDDGSSSSSDSIYITIDGNGITHALTQAIEIRTGHVWFGNLHCTVADIHCICARAAAASTSTAAVQADVFAIIDDVT
jgi:hypothetical protein